MKGAPVYFFFFLILTIYSTTVDPASDGHSTLLTSHNIHYCLPFHCARWICKYTKVEVCVCLMLLAIFFILLPSTHGRSVGSNAKRLGLVLGIDGF